MKFTPHSYQEDAIQWCLERKSAGLLLNPGLGKTAIILQTFKYLKAAGAVDNMLVIAPLRVCSLVWPEQIKHWDDFNEFSIVFLRGKNKDDLFETDADIYTINPENLKWLSEKRIRTKFERTMLVVDESTKFKNHSSQRFKVLKKMLPIFERRYILTGTPAPNGLIQLWSQIYVLDEGARLGRFISHFRREYFNYDPFTYRYSLKSDRSADMIYDAVNDIVMHKGVDELSLPDRVNSYIRVTLPDNAVKVYSAMKKDFAVEVSEDEFISAVNAAVMSSKLKQISNGAMYGEDKSVLNIHSAKVDALEDLYDSLQGSPLLVMYEYDFDYHKLIDRFPGTPCIGKDNSRTVEKAVAKWNRGELPLLFLHPQAGGHGLNLQNGGCTNICWYSIPFDLELYEQANARVHRQGVKSAVMIHHIVSEDTIDEHILTVLSSKATVQAALMLALKK